MEDAMINLKSGMLIFDDFMIRPHMLVRELLNVVRSQDILSCDKGAYTNILLKPQKSANNFFTLRLFFEKKSEELEFCQMVVQDDNIVPSWEGWSMEKELQKKEYNDIWLIKDVGYPPYIFSWGKLQSVYNAKEASSYIMITYN